MYTENDDCNGLIDVVEQMSLARFVDNAGYCAIYEDATCGRCDHAAAGWAYGGSSAYCSGCASVDDIKREH